MATPWNKAPVLLLRCNLQYARAFRRMTLNTAECEAAMMRIQGKNFLRNDGIEDEE